MIGQRLSHYQIVERIGAGGMGVVYRAHDEQLDRDVAIKVLPPGSLADDTARKRFRQEALSLARLNHPNIATIHEFGTQDDTDFLVTEFIAGITLDIKLVPGPLSSQEVVRLGMQLAEGLSAAHSQGIVHRDLKPGNLRLTVDGRLKILDFGLAQLMPHASEMGMTLTMTQSQEVTGTLPYMAPEQLAGQGADARSDLWSAGAVLYEMAAGKRPFAQSTPALLISAILNQPAEPPSKIDPAIPAALDQVILKALAKDLAQRYQTAGELAADLALTLTPTSPIIVQQPKRKSYGLAIGILAAALAIAIGGYLFTYRNKHAASISGRRSIAVIGFKNLSGNPEKSWLSTALSEMLTTELSQGDQLRTIPGESVAQMKASLSLPDAESFSQQTLERIRKNLGSDDVIVGSYLSLGNGLMRLDLRMQETVAGETLASVSEKGNESEIDNLISKAGTELRAKLGVASLSDAQSASVRASLPANPEAARLYSEGLQKLRVFDALAARNLLEKAAAIDPSHAPTHSALAQAWLTLGYDAKAKEQAKLALDLSANSSREERLLIEGSSHELLGEQPQAIENYRALWQFFPDQVDYGLSLIRSQVAAGQGSDAETTLASLRKLPLSDADAARVDLAEANIAHSQGDFKRQQSSAAEAANRGRAAGANLLVAEALQVEGSACERMGQSDRSIDLVSQAGELYAAAGNRQGAARALLMHGDALFDRGDFEGARKKFDDALLVFQEIGSEKSTRGSFERIGNVLYGEGKLQESEKYYNRALRFDLSIHDPSALASDYGNIANDLDGLGELTGALKMQLQALAAFNEVGDRSGSSATLNNLGNLSVEMGNLAEAKKYFDQALSQAREIAFRSGEPYPIAGLGDVLLAQGDIAGARKQYDDALALCAENKDDNFAAQIHTTAAFIALVEKKFPEGETLARETVAFFEKSNSPGNNSWAHAILARNLLGEGRLAEARAAAEQAKDLSHQAAGDAPGYDAILADSRVKSKLGKAAEGRQELETMLASTRKHGYRFAEYNARLALAEIERESDSPAAAPHLSSLESDAKTHDALLVAGQAHALLQAKSPQTKTK
jgi:serine/threonine protein kinase/predicted negative regulator of RcsB-dependent stress response